MDFVSAVITFLLGIFIGPVLIALANGQTVFLSQNFKYFGFSFRIGSTGQRLEGRSEGGLVHSGSRVHRRPTPWHSLERSLPGGSSPGAPTAQTAEPQLHPGASHHPQRAATPQKHKPRHPPAAKASWVRGTRGWPHLQAQGSPWSGDSAKMSKRKPSLDEEPKKEMMSDEESGEETTPGDEPKEETTSDGNSGGETNPGGNPSDDGGDSSDDGGNPRDDSGNPSGDGGNPSGDGGPGKKWNIVGTAIGGTVGAGVALVGLPLCIGALGFTGAGIAAGSIAAKMMSAAAIANGGGVAAGSTVAVLQSIGAAGFSLGTKIGLTSALSAVGGASGAFLSRQKKPPSDKRQGK